MKKASFPLPGPKLLKSSSYFRDWPSQALKEVGALFKVEAYEKGAELIQENKRARFLFILLKGTLALSIRKGSGDLIIEIIKKRGALWGWSAIVPPRKYTASAKALEPVKVLKIRGHDLDNFLNAHPPLASLFWQKLAHLIARRLSHMRSLLIETLA